MLAFSHVLIVLRGPHEPGWIGWRGGWRRQSVSDGLRAHDPVSKDPEVAVELGEASVEPSPRRTGSQQSPIENVKVG